MAYSCGECGRDVITPGLCWRCSATRDESLVNSRRQADAAEELLSAQRASDRDRRDREAEREIKEQAQAIVGFANRIDSLLPSSGANLKQVWGALAEMSGITGDLEKWEVLLHADHHGIEFAYPTLRQRIVPYVIHLSRIKDQSVPQRLLQDYAVTFRYPDIIRAIELNRQVTSLDYQFNALNRNFVRSNVESKKSRDGAMGCLGFFVLVPCVLLNIYGTSAIVATAVLMLICLASSAFSWSRGESARKAAVENHKKALKAEELLREGQQLLSKMADQQLEPLLDQNSDTPKDEHQVA